ncbi:MAG: hypothetical protein QM809_11970 [Gordonia sp. (in: high G+C Gram-positive bacteria)]|uniref:hypothetical protein n=1 Tax=Gordonia sp. (in: high G+C Gram-positive bacteria) TaxID=84139 RepID=UPI0039E5783C
MRRSALLIVGTAAVLAAAGCSSGGADDASDAPEIRTVTTTVPATGQDADASSTGASDPFSVDGVITPSKSDRFVTALRKAAETGGRLTIAIEAARKEAEVPLNASGDTKVVVFRTSTGLASYTIRVNDHYRQECSAPLQLGLPDFRMCQTVTVERDPTLVEKYLPNADKASVGDDAFSLTTVS